MLALAVVEVGDERLGAAAEVADAHRRGEGAAVQLAEGLDLHAAGERGQAVGHKVEVRAHRGHDQEQGCLDQQHVLAPVHARRPVELGEVGECAAAGKGDHGAEVVGDRVPIARGDVHAEQKEVAGLCVGKDPVAAQVGVGVHEAAGQGEDEGELQGFGCLGGAEVHGRAFRGVRCRM